MGDRTTYMRTIMLRLAYRGHAWLRNGNIQGKIAACDRPDTVINRSRARFHNPQTQTLTLVIGLAQSLHSRSQTGFDSAVTGQAAQRPREFM